MILSALGGLTVAAGAVPAPLLDDNPSTPGDVSGPCDKPENADDARCAGTTAADPAPTTTIPAISGVASSGVIQAADAGSVSYSFDGTTFTVLDSTAVDMWTVVVERAAGIDIEVKFLRGTVRVDVQVEFEHGAVRERVRIRDRADDSEIRFVNGTVTRTDDGSGNSGHGHGSDNSDNSDNSDDSD